MKTYGNIFFVAFLLACLACSESENQVDSKGDVSVKSGSVVQSASTGFIPVAKIDPTTGKVKVLVDKFVKTFEDGGPIKFFGVRKTGAKYGFVRMGYDISGHYRSETFETETAGISIGLKLNFGAAWYILCSGSCSGCMATANGTKCECDTHLELENGQLIVVDASGNEQESLDQNGSGGNCASGGGFNTSYPTIVFQ